MFDEEFHLKCQQICDVEASKTHLIAVNKKLMEGEGSRQQKKKGRARTT
jgi:hypothetical protein